MMGRVTLVRSILNSILVYLLSNIILSKTLVGRLEQFFWSFLWGSRLGGGGGMYLLMWEVVCQPLRDRGLGVQSLAARQEVFIAQHMARFLLDPRSLWSTVMRARYKMWMMDEEIQVGWDASFLWKEIYAHALGVRC